MPALSTYLLGTSAAAAASAVVVTADHNAKAIVEQLGDVRHACTGTSVLTSTTTRIVPLSEQAANRARWLVVCGDHDRPIGGDDDDDDDDGTPPYVSLRARWRS
jgi:hypothetical protein